MKAADGTPIAEDLRGTDALTLVKRIVAAEERLNSMAHEPFNTPEELMQDLIRENSEFTKTIVRLRERERVLREALFELSQHWHWVAPGKWVWMGEGRSAPAFAKAALATPAPEQPAQPSAEKAESDGPKANRI